MALISCWAPSTERVSLEFIDLYIFVCKSRILLTTSMSCVFWGLNRFARCPPLDESWTCGGRSVPHFGMEDHQQLFSISLSIYNLSVRKSE